MNKSFVTVFCSLMCCHNTPLHFFLQQYWLWYVLQHGLRAIHQAQFSSHHTGSLVRGNGYAGYNGVIVGWGGLHLHSLGVLIPDQGALTTAMKISISLLHRSCFRPACGHL